MKTIAILAAALFAAAPLAAQDPVRPDTTVQPAVPDSVLRDTLGGRARGQEPIRVDSAAPVIVDSANPTVTPPVAAPPVVDPAAPDAAAPDAAVPALPPVADPAMPDSDKPEAVPEATPDADMPVAGGGALPAGWSARGDKTKELADVSFATMGDGFHVTTGPAGIYYRTADKVENNFHAEAELTQTKAPEHPEAYGVFFGGTGLEGTGQKYTYFLVRGDGQFTVRQRNADIVNTVVDWTPNAAVIQADAEGKATNTLTIDAKGETITFGANGQTLHTMDVRPDQMNGVVGLRVNHNLDVHVSKFDVDDQK
jgi:hypothetical protein